METRARLSDKRWLSPPAAAEYLGIAVSTLYRWRKEGRIRFYQFGGRVSRIKREELDALARPQPPDSAAARQEWHKQAETLFRELYEQYGVGDDSAKVIREAREQRSRQLGRG